jgi:hypothetical protein
MFWRAASQNAAREGTRETAMTAALSQSDSQIAKPRPVIRIIFDLAVTLSGDDDTTRLVLTGRLGRWDWDTTSWAPSPGDTWCSWVADALGGDRDGDGEPFGVATADCTGRIHEGYVGVGGLGRWLERMTDRFRETCGWPACGPASP